MKYIVHEDGSFDLLGSSIQLRQCYPHINGTALRALRVEASETKITYLLSKAQVRLSFRTEDEGRLAIDCTASGLTGIHDLAPIGNGEATGMASVYVQGFGMEGPSGLYQPKEEIPVSHGLTALSSENNTMLVWSEDHRHYSAGFRVHTEEALFGTHIRFSGGFNLEGTAGEEVTLPTLYIQEYENREEGLHSTAKRIAKEMHARHVQPPAFFWSSWYHAYETFDQAGLEQLLAGIQEEQIPFQYIELDAGYTAHIGDWLKPNHRWPNGLKHAAETIRNAGYQPGVWVAPFIVGDQSDLYREHPDWVIHDLEGKPVVQLRSCTEPKIWGNPDCDYYVLDTSHPDALMYIEEVFMTLKRWGFALFKTDFMLWNMHDSSTVRRYDRSLTSVEIMRRTLGVIRKAIGEESYLLGCIAPFMPFIGCADGMRLAGDCGAQWTEPYGPVNMLRELPYDSYFNNVFWQNDPDAVLLRDFDTNLREDEVHSLALLQALSGGVVSTSDPVQRLGSARRQLLRLIQPGAAHVSPEFWKLGTEVKELTAIHHLEQGNLLYVMNPTDTTLHVFYRLSELFGKENLYQYQYNWKEEEVCSRKDDIFTAVLAPHCSALVYVTEEPLTKKPTSLWNW